jgi:YfiR/HmsC-like
MARRARIVGLTALPAGILAGILVVLLPVRGARASPDKRAIILVRALTYDDNLKKRMGGELIIAVAGRRDVQASETCSGGMYEAFSALRNIRVLGAPLRVVQHWYSSGDALTAAVASQGIDVIYVCEGLDNEVGVIVDIARKQQVLSMAASEALIVRGVALGVVIAESKPTLLVNLTSAKSSGAALSTDLLRVAKVIR